MYHSHGTYQERKRVLKLKPDQGQGQACDRLADIESGFQICQCAYNKGIIRFFFGLLCTGELVAFNGDEETWDVHVSKCLDIGTLETTAHFQFLARQGYIVKTIWKFKVPQMTASRTYF